MSPRRLLQRRRILNARGITERLAAADHAAAMMASADAAALAERLSHEVVMSAVGTGSTTGALLAAQTALSDRLLAATVQIAAREGALRAGEALAASRAMATRLQRRSAEMLVERAETAVSVSLDRRQALSPRRLPGRGA